MKAMRELQQGPWALVCEVPGTAFGPTTYGERDAMQRLAEYWTKRPEVRAAAVVRRETLEEVLGE